MKKVFALALLSVIHGMRAGAAPAPEWTVATVTSLQKLTAREKGKLEPFRAAPIGLQAAQGEWESFQIVIKAGPNPLQNVRVSTTGLATPTADYIPRDNIHFYRENYVLVDKPSGNRRLEKLWWPDALIPFELQPIPTIDAEHSEVLWVAIRVPEKAAAGDYYATITIESGEVRREIPVSLQVEPVTVPKPSMRANVAVYYDVVRDWYNKNLQTLSDEEFATLKKRYYDFLLDYRINAYDLPVAWDGESADEYLTDPRVRSVRVPPLDRPDFPTALETLRQTRTLNKAYYYWIDEPSPDRYAAVRETTKKLHETDAALRHCVTAHPNESLKNAVDIWCPNIGDYFGLGHIDFAVLEAERRKGRETWWYTMVEPKAPYPTWLLDDDAAAVRIYGWMMARWNITGFVYSMAHGWGPKPLENLQSFAGTNGDGTLLYPAELVGGTGPMPSIRLMLLRDAIEDYELVQTLPQEQKESLLHNLVGNLNLPLMNDRARDLQAWQTTRQHLFSLLTNKQPGTSPTINTTKSSLARRHIFYRAAQPPQVDGSLDGPLLMPAHQRGNKFAPPIHEGVEQPETEVWTAHDVDFFYVGIRVHTTVKESKGEWVAADFAPVRTDERWRFIVTRKGNTVVERHSREGQFRMEVRNWKGATKSFAGDYTVEMRIPKSIVGNAAQFRFNVRRRFYDEKLGINFIEAMRPDANDATLMPIATIGGLPPIPQAPIKPRVRAPLPGNQARRSPARSQSSRANARPRSAKP